MFETPPTPGPGFAPPAATAVASDGSFADERAAALRALRNLEATKERLERSAKQDAEDARGNLVLELVPVVDNLDRMVRAAQADSHDPALLAGVMMVRAQLESVLHRFGASRVESLHQRFDPSCHEAIAVVPVADAKLHGVVLAQAEPGYALAGRLLRPAKVSVGRAA
jgi:molecular chaperone GrpE